MRRAFYLVILLGVVSFFADVTYEGARSVTGAFLAELSSPAIAVGFVGGFGELVAFTLRIFSGILSDRTKKYWFFAFLGYFVNLFSVPLLAFARSWEVASLLIVLERFGKAIRAPARDTIISFASEGRYGRAFAVHEVLDQLGAVSGPLLIALIIPHTGLKNSFLILAVPAFLAIITLFISAKLYPKPHTLDGEKRRDEEKRRGGKDKSKPLVDEKQILLFLSFVFVQVAGFPHFQLVSFHLGGDFPAEQIAVFFALAMGVDAIAGIFWGILWDRVKHGVVFLVPFITASSSFFIFTFPVAGVFLWGAVMGFYETAFKSAISELSPSSRRGTIFGIFHAVFGLGWLSGGVAMGFLYPDIKKIIAFSVACQIISLFIFSFFFFVRKVFHR